MNGVRVRMDTFDEFIGRASQRKIGWDIVYGQGQVHVQFELDKKL